MYNEQSQAFCTSHSPCLAVSPYPAVTYCRKKERIEPIFTELEQWLMAESLWEIARDFWLLLLQPGSCVKRWRGVLGGRGGWVERRIFLWPVDLHLEIRLGWTERALAVTAASFWMAFAKRCEFMKCAEDVTLASIHFINELLRKLISHPGPLYTTQEHACVAQNATVNKQGTAAHTYNATQMFTGT